MILPDFKQEQRELIRWRLAQIAGGGSSIGVPEAIVISVLAREGIDVTRQELNHQVRYMVDLGYLKLNVLDDGSWRIIITPSGVNLLEYNADCPAGIQRPSRYPGREEI